MWRLATGDLAAQLKYRPDPSNPSGHGFIEPAYEMTLTAYQAALEATRDSWQMVRARHCGPGGRDRLT